VVSQGSSSWERADVMSARLKWFARVRDAGASMIFGGFLIGVPAVEYFGAAIIIVSLTISIGRWYRARGRSVGSSSGG
jgi:hypothetical protein